MHSLPTLDYIYAYIYNLMRLLPKISLIISPPALMSVFLIFYPVYLEIQEQAKNDAAALFAKKLSLIFHSLEDLDVPELQNSKVADTITAALDREPGRVLLVSKDGHTLVDTIGAQQAAALPVSSSGELSIPVQTDIEKQLVERYILAGGIQLLGFMPERISLATIDRQTNTLAVAAFVGTFMGVVTFMFLLKYLVLSPLNKTREVALRLGDPDYCAHENIGAVMSRKDEIGDLARAINTTSRSLTSSYAQLQTSHEEIERLANHDHLTDLPNRRMFHEVLNEKIAQSQSRRLHILFIDLNDFKKVNDLLGHEAGDNLLMEVGRRFLGCLNLNKDEMYKQRNNFVARLGGDEFIILLNENDDDVTGECIAKAILAALDIPVILQNQSFVVQASIGIAIYPDHGDCVRNLIANADTAMYEAKILGNNNYAVYNQSMSAVLENRRQLEIDLEDAITKNQLSLHYQPKYLINTMQLYGAEALLRWQHPVHGWIPPDKFIQIAEERDLIIDIGHWVLDEACKQWRAWKNLGYPISQIAINVSILQFAADDVYTQVCQILDKYDMPPEALEIELTESCVVEAVDEVLATLNALRKHGVVIAMDDFGTGYSSLGAIATLPIDTLKLDRSFIKELRVGSVNEKIVNAILMMAKSLDLSVVAEGIENPCELDLLRAIDCDFAQGFLLSRPLPVDAMTSLLEEDNLDSDKISIGAGRGT